MVTAQIK